MCNFEPLPFTIVVKLPWKFLTLSFAVLIVIGVIWPRVPATNVTDT